MGAVEIVSPDTVEAKLKHHLVMLILLTRKGTSSGG
jgi:hypothetical protein